MKPSEEGCQGKHCCRLNALGSSGGKKTLQKRDVCKKEEESVQEAKSAKSVSKGGSRDSGESFERKRDGNGAEKGQVLSPLNKRRHVGRPVRYSSHADGTVYGQKDNNSKRGGREGDVSRVCSILH